MNRRTLLWTGSLASLVTFVVVACITPPDIDGSTVPTVGSESSPPSCEEVCDRLTRLCGEPLVNCPSECPEGGYDDPHRVCVGAAASCQSALNDCVNAEPTEEEDAGEAGLEEDATAPLDDASPE